MQVAGISGFSFHILGQWYFKFVVGYMPICCSFRHVSVIYTDFNTVVLKIMGVTDLGPAVESSLERIWFLGYVFVFG